MLVSPFRNQINSWTIDFRCSRLVVTSGKPCVEVEAHLPAEQRTHAGAGAVALDDAVARALRAGDRDRRASAPGAPRCARFGSQRRRSKRRERLHDDRPQAAPGLGGAPWAKRSVQADGLELVFPGVGDRRVAGVGQHDRRSVGGEQREEFEAGRTAGAWGNRRCASSERIVLT